MTKQIELIGDHPSIDHPLGTWLIAKDIPATDTKCHRELTERNEEDNAKFILWMANKLIHHHYTEFRIRRLQKKFTELGYKKYAEQNRKLPKADKVKKGNATEIILTEYIQSTLNRELIKVFKLKYNPNVDQAIKGDDTLMVDLIEHDDNSDLKIYLGESKFRKNPSKSAVNEISSSLENDKMPLSYSFLVDEIQKTNPELALKLDDFIVQDIKDKGNLIYTGLLLSNQNTSTHVERSLNNDNPKLIFISIGVNEPEHLINSIYDKANELLKDPTLL